MKRKTERAVAIPGMAELLKLSEDFLGKYKIYRKFSSAGETGSAPTSNQFVLMMVAERQLCQGLRDAGLFTLPVNLLWGGRGLTVSQQVAIDSIRVGIQDTHPLFDVDSLILHPDPTKLKAFQSAMAELEAGVDLLRHENEMLAAQEPTKLKAFQGAIAQTEAAVELLRHENEMLGDQELILGNQAAETPGPQIKKNSIPPEYRTIPLTLRQAADYMGYVRKKDGTKLRNEKNAVKILSASIREGSIPCEHFSRQSHVFDRRSFPAESQADISPKRPR